MIINMMVKLQQATWVQVPSAWQILVALPKSWNPGWQSYEIWCKDAGHVDGDGGGGVDGEENMAIIVPDI